MSNLFRNIKKHIYKEHVFYIGILILIGLYFYTKQHDGFTTTSQVEKIVVFDLDETLGHFAEISIFCNALEHFYNMKLTDQNYFAIFDHYPEYFRTNIFQCLELLKKAKEKGICSRVVIYTNNNGEKEWTNRIKTYLEKKIKYPLFDQVIATWKIGEKVIEPKRTTFEKTYEDLMRCLGITEEIQICFIDNMHHPKMLHPNIFYIQCSDYIINVPNKILVGKYLKGDQRFLEFFSKNHKKYAKTHVTQKDITIGDNLYAYLEAFINGGEVLGQQVKL